MTAPAPMLEVERVETYRGPAQILRSVSLSLAAGEAVCLVGRNGAGKTTTLRSLAGILVPTAGEVRIAGFNLATDPVAAKRHLAFIPDEPHLFDHLTVEEHLAFVARLYGVTDAASKGAALLRELELATRPKAFPNELSRGMKQKLAIACGLLHDPTALILDEPLTGLDPLGIRRMKATIMRRASEGAAVILSSHLLHLVEEVCTRVLVLRRGRVVTEGTIATITAARPELAGRSLEDVFIALVGEDAP